ncbi:MAG: ABC transporter ATP-binding protein [Candidatus Marinimicrobia bacterium]|jgi:putative ABC transport system ATP-binding protein|nr:ABC transporter ATP-binding protein [Candidatus Neomarinimicrobiota bacterium]MBT4359952.1 ABC transporter ATP-binding protein [Candidatus Neomarinimicrobiota bacterium]MBT4715837.1 ABC transporter ATP-binding protein [Candidatus Neomarinimicrobiota bacterium]MBT4947822.1 ABC transporter ATP-binding protein [Candidatus Neomarinimicrobiota bacterium]MBT5271309.1 ABC transporter ATP-binding protein [Candidatus Neomarinimicrobiota bacterium]
MTEAKLIHTHDLVKAYPVADREFVALKNVNLEIERGEFAGLVGPSGSGKTTLLNVIGSLDIPTSGSVTVLDSKIEVLSHKQAANLRNLHIGFIFQTYNLLPVYTVAENVEFPLLLLGKSSDERRSMVEDALEWVGLTDKAEMRPAQLSGGESQRVAIARAMVKKPALVLADEPTANLDAKNSHRILETMEKLNAELDTTFLFATHDEKVMQYMKRIISLEDGEVVKDETK